MPAVSGKQYRLMQMMAHGGGKGPGPSPEVAQEFVDATPPAKRKAWAKPPKKGKGKPKPKAKAKGKKPAPKAPPAQWQQVRDQMMM